MKNKERTSAMIAKLKSSKPVQAVQRSRAVVWLQGIHTFCGKNAFLIKIALTLCYRLTLDLMYVIQLSPHYGYSGFTVSIFPLGYLASLLAVLAFSPFVVRLLGEDMPSSILVSFINYLYFIPLTSYYACKGASSVFFAWSLLYWAVLLLLQYRLPILRLAPFPVKHLHTAMKLLTLGSILLVFFISGRYTGFRLTFDLLNVYDIRTEALSYSIPTIFAYLLTMMTVTLSLLILYWLQKKKYVIVALLCVTYLFYFSIAAHKSVFFFLFLVLACWLLYREWMLRWLPGLLALVPIVAILEERLIGSIYLMALFLRRMLYVPTSLGERFFQYFSDNPLNLAQNGIMGNFSFDNIYSIDLPRLIGEYTRDVNLSANNGMLGQLFTDFPVPVGLLLLPLILVICFRLLDLTAGNLGKKILLPFCLFYAVVFANSAWSVVLLTHGFLLACLLLYIFPKEVDLK